jgi:hypothetical protein
MLRLVLGYFANDLLFRCIHLDIFPLVQTLGRLKWIFKLEESRKYRDSDTYLQVCFFIQLWSFLLYQTILFTNLDEIYGLFLFI